MPGSNDSLTAFVNCTGHPRVGYFMKSIGPPPEVEIALASFLSLFGFMAMFGNVYAIYYFVFGIQTAGSNPRNKPLFIHLACMDCIFGILTIIYGRILDFGRFRIMCMVSSPYDWAFELQQLLGALYENVPVVILNVMAAISAFRLYAIILPFSYRYVKRRTFHLIGATCYVIPIILAFLPLWALIGGKRLRYNFNSLYGIPFLDVNMLVKDATEERRRTIGILYSVLHKFTTTFIPILLILISSSVTSYKIISRQKLSKDAKIGPAVTILIMAIVILVSKAPYLFLICYDLGQTLGLIHTVDTAPDGKVLLTYSTSYLLMPSCWIVDSLSSVINPFIYHFRAKSLFDRSHKPGKKTREENLTKSSTISSSNNAVVNNFQTTSMKVSTATFSIRKPDANGSKSEECKL